MDKFYLLDTDLVLKIHHEIIEKYNSNAEIRDIKLLESAVVSLTTGKEDVELYTEIINLIDIAEEIEIKVSN